MEEVDGEKEYRQTLLFFPDILTNKTTNNTQKKEKKFVGEFDKRIF